jgi:heptosyltransferase I
VIAVDTGLLHVAAALNVPTISIYGATDPQRTGSLGHYQRHLSAAFECSPCLKRECRFPQQGSEWPPCYGTITPETVAYQLMDVLNEKNSH